MLKRNARLVNKRDNEHDRRTPLHTAAQCGQDAAGELLLKYGADITAPEGLDGYQAIHTAAASGHKTFVQLLLRAQGTDRCQRQTGLNPLARGKPEGEGRGGRPTAPQRRRCKCRPCWCYATPSGSRRRPRQGGGTSAGKRSSAGCQGSCGKHSSHPGSV